MIRLICADFLKFYEQISINFELIFVDPPYNEGIDYGGGKSADNLKDGEYLDWCWQWMLACKYLLTNNGSLWVLCSETYADELSVLLKGIGLNRASWIIWHESFGNYCHNKFGKCHRHLFHYVMDPNNYIFNADGIRVLSDRQIKYKDKRANPKGKIPPNVWNDIPRLCGTHKERISGFPTQLPLSLLRRIILCATNVGDFILDPMCGSGTSGVVSAKLGRHWLGIEKNPEFADKAINRLESIQEGK